MSELPDLSSEHPLSAEEIARYRREGFVVLRQVLRRDEVDPFRPHVREAWWAHRMDTRPIAERDTYGRAFTQALHLGQIDAATFRFAYARRFAKLAADLMGVPAVRMFLDEAFFKEPGSGPTPWHQDQPVWPFEEGTRGVTLWIPLMDVTTEMGTLTFSEGSHLSGQLVSADISDESDAELAEIVAERAYRCRDVGAMAVGDVTAHDGWTVHRAGPNRTDVTREAYAMHYFSDGARVVAAGDTPARERTLRYFAPELSPGDLAASSRWRRVYPHVDPVESDR